MSRLPQAIDPNSYDSQENFIGSGGRDTALSSHSPETGPPVGQSHDAATASQFYSEVRKTLEVSGNGSSAAVYSETNNTTRMVVVSHDTHGLASSHQQTTQHVEYSTPHLRDNTSSPQMQEKYAKLAFEETRTPLPSLGFTDEPVKYSMVQPSTKNHTPPPRPPPPGSAQAVKDSCGDKHPLDQKITIDMAIQQLQRLTPHWWEVGEAAGVQRPTLKEISAHFKGNKKESFSEVMNLVFMPNKTTWTELAGVCERAGFSDLANTLLDAYNTGELPVQVDDDTDTLQRPPPNPAPPVPPRGAAEDEDQYLPPIPPPYYPEDTVPPLPPSPSAVAPPSRPPKVTKPPARPPRD